MFSKYPFLLINLKQCVWLCSLVVGATSSYGQAMFGPHSIPSVVGDVLLRKMFEIYKFFFTDETIGHLTEQKKKKNSTYSGTKTTRISALMRMQ